MNVFRFGVLSAAALAACAATAFTPSVTLTPFGKRNDGKEAFLYTLVNRQGMKVEATNHGAIIVRLFAPDRLGRLEDVVLGYADLDGYLKATPYFGAVVGRVGNRIAEGRFTLDGTTYTLATNNSPGGRPCHLHGGKVGFDKVLWDAEPLLRDGRVGLRLKHVSPDGEEGYPGTLTATVTYWLTDENVLRIEYQAVTDKPTPVNLTQHSYFNLRGEGEGDILGHVLTLAASRMTPVDVGLIPTGEIRSVKGTPFDFTSPRIIGERVNADDDQIRYGGGYDHNWVIDGASGSLRFAASVFEPYSGRVMEVWTEEPGIQFYGGNFLDSSNVGKRGRPYVFRGGFCLETQHFPDSPNQPGFPGIVLRPGSVYRTSTEYRFSAR
jgi:aldose 1-epimerase